MNFNPVGDRVLIKGPKSTKSTVHDKCPPLQGEIVAIGNEIANNDLFQIGNTAIFLVGYEIHIADQEYSVVHTSDIMGILKKEGT